MDAKSGGDRRCVLILMTVLVGARITVDTAFTAEPAAAATHAEAAPAALPLAYVRGSAVDPATGRIFVAHQDGIEVFAGDGTRITTVTGIIGPGALAVAGGSLWATTDGQALAEVDIATSTLVRTVPTILPLDPQLVVVGRIAFTVVPNPYNHDKAVLTIDLVTGVNKGTPGFNQFRLLRATARGDRVFLAERGGFGSRVRTIRAVAPYDVLGSSASTTPRTSAPSSPRRR